MEKSPLKAFGRSLSDFGRLTVAEQKLLEACQKGEFVTISEHRPEQPTEHNVVRASFLRFLTLGGDENVPVHEQGLGLQGAWVTGELNLNNLTVPKNLWLINSHFDTTPSLIQCTVQCLNLSGCYVNGLNADNLVCSASVVFDELFSTGEVSLKNAKIDGQLQCIKSKFKSSLNFDNAEIKGDVFLHDVYATGMVRFMSAQIAGGLECLSTQFENDLNAENAVIKGNVRLNGNADSTKKFISHGVISFLGTQIGGDFYCKNSQVTILACRRAIITGNVFLKDFIATTSVIFTDSQIGGLDCETCEFNEEGHIENFSAVALSCESAVINGKVDLIEVTVNGVVNLIASRIGSDLVCQNSNFNGNGEYALRCESAVISGKVVLGEGFNASGIVSFARTVVMVDLQCNGGTINGKNEETLLINAEALTVTHFFHFQNMNVINGKFSLMNAKVGTLIDDADSWSEGQFVLNGFVYERFDGKSVLTNAKSRIAWLDKQHLPHTGREKENNREFRPQPWQQLQKVFREMGYIEDARQVAIKFEDRLREANLIGQTDCYKPIARIYQKICCFFHWCFGMLIGYGYRPLRLFFIMLGIWLACGVFYSYAAYEGVFAPSNPLVFQNPKYDICTKSEIREFECTPKPNWYLCSELREEYTGFSPFLYSLDLILPLVDLQQEHDWSPMIPTPKNTWFDELKSWDFPKHITRLVMWLEILFGWLASLLLVAVVSGLTKRREE